MIHASYCDFHLGDHLIHLHFLRKISAMYHYDQFIHVAHACHLGQLLEVVKGCPNVLLKSFEWKKEHGDGYRWRNVWKNADEYWARSPLRADYAKFYLDWFWKLSKEIGAQGSPFEKPEDLLFDYPALQPVDTKMAWIDFLVCNSQPCSGQLKSYDGPNYFLPLMDRIAKAGKTAVVTSKLEGWPWTAEYGWSISRIGRFSTTCKAIVGICNGPMWPCLSVHNLGKPVFVIMDHVLGEESVAGLKPNMVQVKTMDELINAIHAKGLL